jgi:hypothetical protein
MAAVVRLPCVAAPGHFDAVPDFDKVVRDPNQSERLLPTTAAIICIPIRPTTAPLRIPHRFRCSHINLGLCA